MRRLLWLWSLLASACIAFGAQDWELIRFEGRDYVPLDNIANFYGFPPPPLIDPSAPEPAAEEPSAEAEPEATTTEESPAAAETGTEQAPAKPEEAQSDDTPETTPAEAIASAKPVPPAPLGAHIRADTQILPVALKAQKTKTVALDSGRAQIRITAGSRESYINGVKQWLSFPPILRDGKILVSRMDLSKTIEPRLRPEKIDGMKPVRTVVIDAGHGGHDKGAASKYGYEKDFSLDVAKRVKAKLERRGMRVIMTRTSDIFIPLHERPRVANNTPDSIFVSIHFNSATSNPAARGFEIYSIAPRGAPATNERTFSIRNLREEPGNVAEMQSTALSASIFHSMLGNVPMEDRGLKHARFAVIRLCNKPSVLIECGFLSNAQESALAGSAAWRQQVADSIAIGIEGYKELAEEKHAPKVVAYYRGEQTPGEPTAPETLAPEAAQPTPQQN